MSGRINFADRMRMTDAIERLKEENSALSVRCAEAERERERLFRAAVRKNGTILQLLRERREYQDTIDGLVDECAEHEEEAERLRQELAQWERLMANVELPEYPVTQFVPKDLERENAKLRELVRLLLYGLDHDAEPADALVWSDEVNRLVKELGVEPCARC